MIVVVTGEKAVGKTTLLLKLADLCRAQNISVAGIVSKRLWKDGVRYGYLIENLADGSSALLASENNVEGSVVKYCSFSFSKSALDIGIQAISGGIDADLVILDEIGNFELAGGGWSPAIKYLLQRTKPIVLAVRLDTVPKLSELGIKADYIIDLSKKHDSALSELINILDINNIRRSYI